MPKTDTILALVNAALEVSRMCQAYAERVKGMTPEQALIEWHNLLGRAVEARTRWERAGDA